MTDEQIEKFAIRVALGNNGGTWATHYTEDQKNHWRKFVCDMESEVALVTAGSLKVSGVAVESIHPNDVVFYEGGLVRRIRPSDGPLDRIGLPPNLRP
jgi:hypothetical protein